LISRRGSQTVKYFWLRNQKKNHNKFIEIEEFIISDFFYSTSIKNSGLGDVFDEQTEFLEIYRTTSISDGK
tara:strand:- start:237 stop:449 length:213 start_codon:yes stop_codon:yes gene_type:complete